MTIRVATSHDLAAVQRCARAAYAVYVERMGRDPAPMVADFSALIDAKRLHVLEEERTVAGFVVFYPRDDHMHLENLAVFPSHHGSGYGSVLISFVEDEARRLGLPAVELYTNEKMTENVPYYLKRGYTKIGCWEEEGFNRIFFRKTL